MCLSIFIYRYLVPTSTLNNASTIYDLRNICYVLFIAVSASSGQMVPSVMLCFMGM